MVIGFLSSYFLSEFGLLVQKAGKASEITSPRGMVRVNQEPEDKKTCFDFGGGQIQLTLSGTAKGPVPAGLGRPQVHTSVYPHTEG